MRLWEAIRDYTTGRPPSVAAMRQAVEAARQRQAEEQIRLGRAERATRREIRQRLETITEGIRGAVSIQREQADDEC